MFLVYKVSACGETQSVCKLETRKRSCLANGSLKEMEVSAKLVVGWMVPTESVLARLPGTRCLCADCLASLGAPSGWKLGSVCPYAGAPLEQQLVFLSADLGEEGETLAEMGAFEILFGNTTHLAAGRSFCRGLGGATHSKPNVLALLHHSSGLPFVPQE